MLNNELYQQVLRAAEKAAQRSVSQQRNLDRLWNRLGEVARQSDLAERISLAIRFSGAIPTGETANMGFQSSSHTLPCTGVDGSQIYPNERRPVVWGYTQALAYQISAPVQPFLARFYEEEDLEDFGNSWLDAQRTLLEMQVMAEATRKSDGRLALFDNNLLAWMGVSGMESLHQQYRTLLAGCKGSLIAGVISSPQSNLLAALIRLADAEDPAAYAPNPRDIRDLVLVRYGIGVGQRTALFRHGSPRNQAYLSMGTGIYFFFLRLTEREVVRVEVPEWVACSREAVDLVHSSILHDSQMIGYPYCLAQAHHLVTISLDLASNLQERADRAYFERARLIEYPSAKAQMKKG